MKLSGYDDIDKEIRALRARRNALLRLARLRQEVKALELAEINRIDINEVVRVIATEVADRLNISPELIWSRNRQQPICQARHLVFYLGRELSGIGLSAMGRNFSVDHATVYHGERKVSERMETEPKFATFVDELRKNLKERLKQPGL